MAQNGGDADPRRSGPRSQGNRHSANVRRQDPRTVLAGIRAVRRAPDHLPRQPAVVPHRRASRHARRRGNGPADRRRESPHPAFRSGRYVCACYVNGQLAGTHVGGYLPFDVDISAFIDPDDAFEIALCVYDPNDSGTQLRGKQKIEREASGTPRKAAFGRACGWRSCRKRTCRRLR